MLLWLFWEENNETKLCIFLWEEKTFKRDCRSSSRGKAAWVCSPEHMKMLGMMLRTDNLSPGWWSQGIPVVCQPCLLGEFGVKERRQLKNKQINKQKTDSTWGMRQDTRSCFAFAFWLHTHMSHTPIPTPAHICSLIFKNTDNYSKALGRKPLSPLKIKSHKWIFERLSIRFLRKDRAMLCWEAATKSQREDLYQRVAVAGRWNLCSVSSHDS